MLDLLIAADQAAHTPERRELLEGLLEGQDRQVERAMEADTDHGELLGDDFFWCFMGLAMAQGDRAFWRTVGNWGYDLRSEVRHPDEDSDASLELGVWGAAFLPPERLDWLVEKNMLAPFKPVHPIKDAGKLSAAEYGMLVGSPELFDYWAPQWKEHYQNEEAKRRHPEHGFHFPIMLNLLLGYQSWREAENPLRPFPTTGFSAEEIQRRIDTIAECVMAVQYPKAPRTERLMPFLKRPTFAHNGSNVNMQGLVRWLVEQESHPWSHGEMAHVFKNKEWGWLKALLENGAPLNPDGKQGLAKGLSKAIVTHDANQDWKKETIACVKAFLKRARTEEPTTEHQFFFPAGAEPAVMQCIRSGNFRNTRVLFLLGADAESRSLDGKSAGALLLNEWRRPKGARENWGEAWHTWQKILPEEKRVPAVENAAAEEQSWLPNELPLDIALVKKQRWEGVESLVTSGFPLSGPGSHGASFGHQLLLEIGNKPDLHTMSEAWDAYRRQALAGKTGGMEPQVLQQDIDQLANDWESHVSFWVRAATFDEVLPKEAPKTKPKPRF